MSEYIPYCHCCGTRHADIGMLCEPCHDYTVRLRALVRTSFHEGFKAAYCTALTDEEAVVEFDRSETKKELERQQ